MSAYGGIAGLVPVTTAFFLVATFSSIGLPGLNGFVGEFLTFLGTWDSPYRWWSVIAVSGIVLSAVYMLTLVQRVFWNPLVHEENKSLTDMRPSELIPAAVLVVLMVWIGVRPNDFLSKINPTLEALRRTTIERTLTNAEPAPRPVSAAEARP
jgi:NADH-quinone oxidoreductase subunit M